MISKLVEESFYKKKIKENVTVILLSILIAIVCVLISYPGIFYSDSYGRIDMADDFRDSINLLLTGHGAEMPVIECWLTIVPSLFMAICRMLTGNIATYTFLQSFAFFMVTFLLIKKLNMPYKWLQYLLVCFNPLFFGEAVYYEAGVGCVVAIGVMILIIGTGRDEKNTFDNAIEFALMMLASFVAFGYRANAYTVLPAIGIFLIIQKWGKIRKVCLTLAVVAGIVAIMLVPKVLNIDTMGSGMAGFVWDMLLTINDMEEEDRVQYIDYLDELAGPGATKEALEINTGFSVLSFLPSRINREVLSQEGASAIVLKKYVQFILREPIGYIGTKLEIAKRNLGIDHELAFMEYEYNLIERMWEWGFNNTNERLLFYRQYYAAVNALKGLVLHPWTVFLISSVLALYQWTKKEENRNICLVLMGLAICYYGAFFINAQAFELRYFYPSLYLMWIMDIGILCNMGLQIKEKIAKKAKRSMA